MQSSFGYWNVRGLGQTIRLVLEYTEEQYEEKTYKFGPPPDYNRDAWFSVKPTINLPFPNLPYYINGDVKLTQSHSILRHLGRKYDLYGKTEKEIMMIDVLMDQGRDINNAFYTTCLNYSDAAASNLKETLKRLSTILGNQDWFVGNKISLADFVLYEELYENAFIDPNYLEAFRNLKSFVKRFEQIPAIKKFIASLKNIKSIINGPNTKFGIE